LDTADLTIAGARVVPWREAFAGACALGVPRRRDADDVAIVIDPDRKRPAFEHRESFRIG